MRSLGVGRYALSSCVAAALLAGCGGLQTPTGGPGAMPQSVRTATSSYNVVYRFCGTFYSLSLSGKHRVLYNSV